MDFIQPTGVLEVNATENAATNSLVDLAQIEETLQLSAFSIPLHVRRLLDSGQVGTNSLPSTNSLLIKRPIPRQLDTLENPRGDSFRKIFSSMSLTSISEGPYNDIWAGSITLRRTAKPNLQNERHRENSLRLSVLEARNLPTKRRYYCDICLDRTLYARTTSKTATDGIFWAEDFDLK
ncbi:hypothetical protein PHET_08633 [Paragonimus heterotremus]|uniref:Uncharacterized protein n=1 Tax=Paragonimus heterotremus TaxID=100268 RepID=A0A8J4SLP8_9TREM|nr:hypothetical protein PHET_08633 [Paragonimus heterotremus]